MTKGRGKRQEKRAQNALSNIPTPERTLTEHVKLGATNPVLKLASSLQLERHEEIQKRLRKANYADPKAEYATNVAKAQKDLFVAQELLRRNASINVCDRSSYNAYEKATELEHFLVVYSASWREEEEQQWKALVTQARTLVTQTAIARGNSLMAQAFLLRQTPSPTEETNEEIKMLCHISTEYYKEAWQLSARFGVVLDDREKLNLLNLLTGFHEETKPGSHEAIYFRSMLTEFGSTITDPEIRIIYQREQAATALIDGRFDASRTFYDQLLKHAEQNNDAPNSYLVTLSIAETYVMEFEKRLHERGKGEAFYNSLYGLLDNAMAHIQKAGTLLRSTEEEQFPDEQQTALQDSHGRMLEKIAQYYSESKKLPGIPTNKRPLYLEKAIETRKALTDTITILQEKMQRTTFGDWVKREDYLLIKSQNVAFEDVLIENDKQIGMLKEDIQSFRPREKTADELQREAELFQARMEEAKQNGNTLIREEEVKKEAAAAKQQQSAIEKAGQDRQKAERHPFLIDKTAHIPVTAIGTSKTTPIRQLTQEEKQYNAGYQLFAKDDYIGAKAAYDALYGEAAGKGDFKWMSAALSAKADCISSVGDRMLSGYDFAHGLEAYKEAVGLYKQALSFTARWVEQVQQAGASPNQKTLDSITAHATGIDIALEATTHTLDRTENWLAMRKAMLEANRECAKAYIVNKYGKDAWKAGKPFEKRSPASIELSECRKTHQEYTRLKGEAEKTREASALMQTSLNEGKLEQFDGKAFDTMLHGEGAVALVTEAQQQRKFASRSSHTLSNVISAEIEKHDARKTSEGSNTQPPAESALLKTKPGKSFVALVASEAKPPLANPPLTSSYRDILLQGKSSSHVLTAQPLPSQTGRGAP